MAPSDTNDDTKYGTNDGTKYGTNDDTKYGTNDGTKYGTNDGTKYGTNDGTDNGTECGTDNGTECGTDNGTDNIDIDKSLSDEEKLIKAIKMNPEITIAEMVKLLNKSRRTVSRMIAKSTKIVRVGPDFGGHWEVKE